MDFNKRNEVRAIKKRMVLGLLMFVLTLNIQTLLASEGQNDLDSDAKRIEEKAQDRYEKLMEFSEKQSAEMSEATRNINVNYFEDEVVGQWLDNLTYKILKVAYFLMDVVSRFLVPLCITFFLIGFLMVISFQKTMRFKKLGYILMIGAPFVFFVVAFFPFIEAYFFS